MIQGINISAMMGVLEHFESTKVNDKKVNNKYRAFHGGKCGLKDVSEES